MIPKWATEVLDSREIEALQDAMAQKDMSADAVVRHYFRMGQMMDTLLREADGNPIGYLDDQGDFQDPFYTGPKMAPMPIPKVTPVTATDPPCGEETCGHAKSAHFSCEVGSFCKDCPSDDDQWTWEHVFKHKEPQGWDSNEICRFHGGDGKPETCRECNRA